MQVNNQHNNNVNSQFELLSKQINTNSYFFSKLPTDLFNEIVQYSENSKMHLINKDCYKRISSYESDTWKRIKAAFLKKDIGILKKINQNLSWNKRYRALFNVVFAIIDDLESKRTTTTSTSLKDAIDRGSLNSIKILVDLGMPLNQFFINKFFSQDSVSSLIYSLIERKFHVAAFLIHQGVVYEDKLETETSSYKRDLFKYLNANYAKLTWRSHGYYNQEEIEFLTGFLLRNEIHRVLFYNSMNINLSNQGLRDFGESCKTTFFSLVNDLRNSNNYKDRFLSYSNPNNPNFIHEVFNLNVEGKIVISYLNFGTNEIFEIDITQAYFGRIVSNHLENKKKSYDLKNDEEIFECKQFNFNTIDYTITDGNGSEIELSLPEFIEF